MRSSLEFYFHTVRYLKPSQIIWRLWYSFPSFGINLGLRPNFRKAEGIWILSAQRRKSLIKYDTFNFLNKIGRLSNLGWDGPQRSKLWRYNQHYFDDLNAVDANTRSKWHFTLLENWVKENPPVKGTGWEPYPTSLRIVNWIKWHLAGHSLPEDCLQSLAIQARWLSRRIERHILGNHLFSNAKALMFAGLFFNGAEAQKWLDMGLNIILQELSEQVLEDGGNFERSPMYHTIFLEDLLDLINLVRVYPNIVRHEYTDRWRAIAIKMLNWLKIMSHPDSEIAFFNDASIGCAPSPTEIQTYANRLGISSNSIDKLPNSLNFIRLLNSGYIRLNAMNAVIFLDVAPIGPDYLTGHAHADTLSFELSLFGERVLVNGGTSQYGSGKTRLKERGTEAHNTVAINGENSSEVWSGFRVARRAYPRHLEVDQGDLSVCVSCSHDGYKRLPGKPIHKRTWKVYPEKLVVQDQIFGNFEIAIALFHFHPDVNVTAIDNCKYLLHLPISDQEVQLLVLNGAGKLEESFFAPEFGIRLKSQCLGVQFQSNDIAVEISWGIDE